jgi:hypothetical protein
MNCKYTVILDIDQTLIDSYEYNPSVHTHKFLSKFEDHLLFSHKREPRKQVVVGRPGLQLFLDYLFHYFNVGVWTAAKNCHADPIVKHFILEPNIQRKLVFYVTRDDIKQLQQENPEDSELKVMRETRLKHLPWFIDNSEFGLNRCSTILIDDSNKHIKYEENQKFIIHLSPFDCEKKNACHDMELYRVVDTLLTLMNHHKENMNSCMVGVQDTPCAVESLHQVKMPRYDTIHTYYKQTKQYTNVKIIKERMMKAYVKDVLEVVKSNPKLFLATALTKDVRNICGLFWGQNVTMRMSVWKDIIRLSKQLQQHQSSSKKKGDVCIHTGCDEERAINCYVLQTFLSIYE